MKRMSFDIRRNVRIAIGTVLVLGSWSIAGWELSALGQNPAAPRPARVPIQDPAAAKIAKPDPALQREMDEILALGKKEHRS